MTTPVPPCVEWFRRLDCGCIERLLEFTGGASRRERTPCGQHAKPLPGATVDALARAMTCIS